MPIPEHYFSRGDSYKMAQVMERFEKTHKERVRPNFYLRIKVGLGSVHLCPIGIADIKGGCSGYEWDTGCEWQRREEQEGANLRIPLRTYTLKRWEAYISSTVIGLYIIWRNFEYEVDFDEPAQLEPDGLPIEVTYRLSSDEK